MQWLSTIDLEGGIVPKPIFFDRENYILIMEAIPSPHENLKTLLLNGIVNLKWINNLGALLGSIHNAGDGSDNVKHIFGDKSFFKVLRLEAYYQFTSKQLPKTKDFFDALIIETLRTEKTVVHGDFSPKNILVKDNRLVLLDHEVMHFGDPAFDVGFFLCHLLSKANHMPGSQDKLLEAAGKFWESYVDKYPVMDDSVERRAVQHTIACLLARCKGRSPLEYLTENEQQKQTRLGLELIEGSILEIPELIEVFKTKINSSIYD